MVSLTPAVLGVLEGIPRVPDNPWVIVGEKPGARLVNVGDPWLLVRAEAGLDGVRIHDLRHSWASRALALGESLSMIGKLLGHSRIETTACYAHLERDTEKVSAAIQQQKVVARGDTADDRQAPRSHAGSDYRSLCAPGERICEGVRFSGRRQHRYAHHACRALMGELRWVASTWNRLHDSAERAR